MSNNTAPKTRAMRYIERRINRPVDEALREMYVDRGMTLKEIADEWGIAFSTVSLWLRHFEIETRVIGLQSARHVAEAV